MELIRFFLVLIVPGIIATVFYNNITRNRTSPGINSTLIFDLLIFITNITGLFYIKGIHTMTMLLTEFECLSFTRNYILLSILVGIIYAIIIGVISRALNIFRR